MVRVRQILRDKRTSGRSSLHIREGSESQLQKRGRLGQCLVRMGRNGAPTQRCEQSFASNTTRMCDTEEEDRLLRCERARTKSFVQKLEIVVHVCRFARELWHIREHQELL